MISKELLSEVMDSKVNDSYMDDQWIGIQYEDASNECLQRTINIYELAYKCKLWATKLGYSLDGTTWLSDVEIYPNYPDKTPLFDMRVCGVEKGYEHRGVCCLYEFNHKQELIHEPEAIFAACEWILNNKDLK